jgi:hypothetical protein
MPDSRRLTDDAPPQTASAIETGLYVVLRIGLVLTGLFVILATLSSHFVTPELLYDERPGPPPLRDRLPQILVSVGIGALLCVPHRWTQRGFLFWSRLAIYVGVAGFLVWRARLGFPVTVVIGCIGLSLPLCLIWSRRIGAAP